MAGYTKNYLSLGAGVQSSTIALMAANGEIEPSPDGAIFADTQAEPASVYRWLDWLETKLPFPVHRVTAGSLTDAALTPHVSAKGRTYYRTAIPFHTLSVDGDAGRIPHRTCTRDYKIVPITKEVRRLCGEDLKQWRRETRRVTKELKALVKAGADTATARAPGPVVCQWIGISLDEMRRMKPARDPWIATRWPLIEKRMTRLSCLEWLRSHGYPEPPRSACVYCPFRSNREWRHLQRTDPDGFAAAVDFDHKARELLRGTSPSSEAFVHRSLKPLGEVDLRNDVDMGQLTLWQDECAGMCGV